MTGKVKEGETRGAGRRAGAAQGQGDREMRNREAINLHQTASFTFLLWYLLTPPIAPGGRMDDQAPLPKWDAIRVFDTAAKCRTSLDVMREDAITNHPPPAAPQARAWAMKCIDDDPRLKGN
jgi:hypothetical protein